jgi:hypothetical protein
MTRPSAADRRPGDWPPSATLINVSGAMAPTLVIRLDRI